MSKRPENQSGRNRRSSLLLLPSCHLSSLPSLSLSFSPPPSRMDEYFAARPNLFSNGAASAPNSTPAGMAASHVQSFAAKNQALTGNIISSGIQHQAAANPQSKSSAFLSNSKVSGALGRFGAGALGSGAAPPPPSSSSSPPLPPAQGAKLRAQGVSGLVSGKSFGHLDTSSEYQHPNPSSCRSRSALVPSRPSTSSLRPLSDPRLSILPLLLPKR